MSNTVKIEVTNEQATALYNILGPRLDRCKEGGKAYELTCDLMAAIVKGIRESHKEGAQ